MHTAEQRIKEITKEFYTRLALFDADSFVHTISSISEYVDMTYQSLLKQYDSRIFFGEIIAPTGLEEHEYNSFQLMKIIAYVSDEMNKNNQNNLQEIVSATTNRSDLPDWLKDRAIKYIPLLLLKSYFQDSVTDEQYVVFLRGKIKQMDRAKLNRFKEKNLPESFDIFIENSDYVSIYIQNRDKLFRAGNYHPFNILTLFLQRLGQSLSYQEIYQLAIKKAEKTIPRDYSKKVYDYLKIIKETIQKSEEVDLSIDDWFKRDYNKGIVHISKSINSCLITTTQHLFI